MKITLEEIKKELRELYSLKDENFVHVNDAADYAENLQNASVPFDDADMRYIANRIDPSFYDIEIEGADKAKEEVLRKLKIILNDCVSREKKLPPASASGIVSRRQSAGTMPTPHPLVVR